MENLTDGMSLNETDIVAVEDHFNVTTEMDANVSLLERSNLKVDATLGLETYLPPLLLATAIATNMMSFHVLQSPPLRTIVNTWYYRVLVWTDFTLVHLLAWPIIIRSFTGTDFRELSVWSCRFWSYFTHVAFDFAHWILGICTLERLLGVSFPHRMMAAWMKKQAWISIWVTGTVSLLVNIPSLVIYDLVPASPYTEIPNTRCAPSAGHPSYSSWMYAEFTLCIIIPFLFVISCNIAIILTLQLSQIAVQSNAMPMPLLTSMSKVLLGHIISTYTLTTPLLSYNLILYFEKFPTSMITCNSTIDTLRLLYAIAYILAITARGVKFITFRFTCPRFRGQFLVMYHGHPTEKEKNSSFASSVRSRTAGTLVSEATTTNEKDCCS